MMLCLWIVTSSLVTASFGVDVDFSIDNSCYSEDDNMKLTAVYTGSGTVTAVQWYYSGQSANNLLVLASTCNVAGGVPAGYPDISRMTFTCDVGTKTYTLTLSNLQNDDFDKSWGATFTLAAGSSPDVQEDKLTFCLTTTTTMATAMTTSPTTTTTTTTTTYPTTTIARSTTTTTSSTSTAMPVTPSITSTHSTTKTSASQSTAQSLSSDDGLSKEMIIVIIVVPTVFTLMGAIITSCICYFKQNSKGLPADHQCHGKGKYYKGNKNPVSGETYLSYGIHYTGQSNHKETNRSKSSHYGQVKQNPLYRVSKGKDPYTLYNIRASSRHEAYRPSDTMTHGGYPTRTCGYHYGQDYHDNKRRQENSRYVSYPGYSRQQQYGNPSFSYYMEH